jgi:hypothetical protein
MHKQTAAPWFVLVFVIVKSKREHDSDAPVDKNPLPVIFVAHSNQEGLSHARYRC